MPLAGWNYHRSLTDSNGTSLTNFVCRLNLTSANFDFSLCKADGSDIRIYDETSAVVVPHWLCDFDPVGQVATLSYLAANTSHAHSIYYGNASATATSSFSSVFLHGTGYDSDFGDLSTTTSGGGSATRVAQSTGKTDARQRRLFRRSQTPTIAGTTNSPDTLVRDFSYVTDPLGNEVTDGSGHLVGYYASLVVGSPTARTFSCLSSDGGVTWTNHTLALTPGITGTYDDSGARSKTVLKFGATDYRMWYTANSSNAALGGVGLATATGIMGPWIRSGSVLTAANCGITAYTPLLSGVPFVRKLANGTYVMFCEARPNTGYPWSVFGWTSPDAVTWTVMNGGGYVINGNGSGFASFGVANPCFVEITPGSLYAILAQGFVGSGTDITTFNGQGGWWTATSPSGSYVVDSTSPVFGRDNTVSGFGEESGGLGIDASGAWNPWLQDYTSTDNSAGSLYRMYPVTDRAGVFLSTVNTDACIAGRVLDAGNFIVDHRCGHTTHRSTSGASYSLALVDSATVPTPDTSTNFGSIVRLGIRRITHGGTSANPSSTPGNFNVLYNDAAGASHTFNGTAWGTDSTVSAGSSDLNREVIATIRDDGTNFFLSATYADTGASIFSATIAKASVKAFSAGRAVFVGEPFTNAWSVGMYSRYLAVRPYAATEPALSTGLLQASSASYTLTAPSPSGALLGVPKTFTVQFSVAPFPSATITPGDSGGGGVFSPTSLVISDTNAHTFTYSNTAAGVYTISTTHSAGSGAIIDPIGVKFAATPAFVAAPTLATTFTPGLVTVGYTILFSDFSIYQVRSTGVTVDVSGAYVAQVSLPSTGNYIIRWDNGTTGYAYDRPAITSSGGGGTVSGVVQASIVQVLGQPIPTPKIVGALPVDIFYTAGQAYLNFDGLLATGTNTPTQVTLASTEPADCSVFVGELLCFVSGNCVNESRIITAAAGRTVTLDKPLVGTPVVGDQYFKGGYAGVNVSSVDSVQILPGVNMRNALALLYGEKVGTRSGLTTGQTSTATASAAGGAVQLTRVVDPAGNITSSSVTFPA